MIDCDHWSECKVLGGGCCAAGHYGGRPSLGVCGQCPRRVVRGEQPIGTSITYGFMDRAKAYLAAEARHAAQGPASVQVQAERAAICRACDGRADEMEGKQDPGGIGFCTKCGCTSKRAALSVKLTLAGATCPLAKWQPVTGEGGNVATAIEAIGGVAGTVADQVKRLLG